MTLRRTPSPLVAQYLLGGLLLASIVLLGGCRATLFAGLNSTDQHRGIAQQRNIVFDATHDLALDVYLPEHDGHPTTAQAPIVVFFYGGDWTHGKRQWYRFVGTALAARGVIVVIPDYRKYPLVRMNGFMQDGARAVAWAHAHAVALGSDPCDIFVMGHSAGGQIAALLATDPRWLSPYGMKPHDLAGFIGLAGVYDFMPIPAYEKDMLGTFGRASADQAQAQPVLFVSGYEPPMLLLQGTGDHEVDPSNALSLDKAMLARHEDVTLKLYPGIGHSPLLFAMSRPLRDHAPTLADILSFIQDHEPIDDRDPPLIHPGKHS
ncbi:alpha/beta hydrolase [Rhodanobacter sp. MP1X3]|uniref:alpha/beta hydrolase n=1 Tax=Rhodanobacter sp. MP1X3 TaxID=2723086 RepID=UPI00162271B1|nr:alpha/beta hydrolase [Rhodanobacter sp. MP1X3]MBB6241375.1 acetyl esterase/lipase [Rhodanobacter sp. MP1X3]